VSEVRGVILDVDGTLVDSNDAHAHAWVEALAEHDYDLPFEKIRRLIGMGGDKLLPAATGQDSQSEIGKRISERRREIFKTRYLPSIKPFPKVRELLSHMRERGLKLVVASSAQPDELDQLLEIAVAKRLVEDTTSSNDADNSKPDPDIVQVALHNLGYPPAEVVMLGDTPYDIEAATKAGINTVALLCGGWSEQDLSQALAIYADPADLLEHYESSPLG
jgi:HAD superfamily hydrolase (TIGR01509 family)